MLTYLPKFNSFFLLKPTVLLGKETSSPVVTDPSPKANPPQVAHEVTAQQRLADEHKEEMDRVAARIQAVNFRHESNCSDFGFA